MIHTVLQCSRSANQTHHILRKEFCGIIVSQISPRCGCRSPLCCILYPLHCSGICEVFIRISVLYRCLEYLLRNDANPGIRDNQGYNAVHYASAYGHRLCLELVRAALQQLKSCHFSPLRNTGTLVYIKYLRQVLSVYLYFSCSVLFFLQE